MDEPRITREFPQGDGDPDCPDCRGRGVVPVALPNRPVFVFDEVLTPCKCVQRRDSRINAKRAWPPLEEVKPVKKSPLTGLEEKNVWVYTPDRETIRHHLKRVIMDRPATWFVRVVSDIEMMDAWLSRDIPDEELLDIDVFHERSNRRKRVFSSLTDLTLPPTLLIIQVGVKASRNEAMPEVLLEVMNNRDHEGKVTWIVDGPQKLGVGHRAYDELVGAALRGYIRIELEKIGGTASKAPEIPNGIAPTVSDVVSEGTGATRSELAEAIEKQAEIARRDRFKPRNR